MNDLTRQVTNLIGYLVKVSAPGKRTRTGVVLGPAPGARNRGLRLAVSADRAIPFDPAQWTITVLHDDEYSYGNLPLDLLAARTALRIERHREPAPGQTLVALYKLRRSYADLYAICDTVPRAPLSPARAAAWTAARTCARCAATSPRPLPQLEHRKGYCGPCRNLLAFERWCEQSRTVQAEAAEWARGVLADPAAVLVTVDRGWDIKHVRAEEIGGALIFDQRVRTIEDLDANWWEDTPEKKAARHAKYDGSIGPRGFEHYARHLTQDQARMIGWSERDTWSGGGVSLPAIDRQDAVGERLALFSGVAPQRHGYWFPVPRLPWSNYPPTYVPYTSHQALRGGSLITELAHLRTLLNLMAHNTPPPPSWVNPTTREVVVDKSGRA